MSGTMTTAARTFLNEREKRALKEALVAGKPSASTFEQKLAELCSWAHRTRVGNAALDGSPGPLDSGCHRKRRTDVPRLSQQ